MRVDDSRIRKDKVADSKISGYVWTGPKCYLTFSSVKNMYVKKRQNSINSFARMEWDFVFKHSLIFFMKNIS